jgi:hypothetical protein
MSKRNPGEVITVSVGGKEYQTIIDEYGVQRFSRSTVLDHLFESGCLDLNQLNDDYRAGKFDKRDYAEFNMALGYSVSGFADLSAFQDWEIQNPVWE